MGFVGLDIFHNEEFFYELFFCSCVVASNLSSLLDFVKDRFFKIFLAALTSRQSNLRGYLMKITNPPVVRSTAVVACRLS
jgi:hypothetical protein